MVVVVVIFIINSTLPKDRWKSVNGSVNICVPAVTYSNMWLFSLVTEMNPNVVVISVLAILSTLLIGLLLVTLVILRKKHLQMAR